jgi:hypothetical protein
MLLMVRSIIDLIDLLELSCLLRIKIDLIRNCYFWGKMKIKIVTVKSNLLSRKFQFFRKPN